ncbi:DUF1398 domain-containing protein [Deinococcus sp. HMF7620]|uniref:DUF1398 domain-containing protein n=2 Tax=Deinococcus arboris TaxID=2682977 RepID=A0A7C9HX81_9DEIO|nr:DUF1398 domain-containing protein [Deinococcus arboris]
MSMLDRLEVAQQRAATIRPKVGGFPYLAECLRQVGVQRVDCDVPAFSMLYVTAEGSVLEQGPPLAQGKTVVPPFQEAALVATLRADQAGETTFPEFMAGSWQAGVVRYHVDLEGRTCTYIGVNGEQYIEHYPHVELPV